MTIQIQLLPSNKHGLLLENTLMFKTNFSKQDRATAFGNNFLLGLYQDSRTRHCIFGYCFHEQ